VHGAIGWDEAMKKGARHFDFDLSKDVVYYPFGTTDFAPFVAKLAALKPDIVLLDVYVIPDMLGLTYYAGESKKQGMDLNGGSVYAFSEHDPALAETPAIQKYTKIYNEK